MRERLATRYNCELRGQTSGTNTERKEQHLKERGLQNAPAFRAKRSWAVHKPERVGNDDFEDEDECATVFVVEKPYADDEEGDADEEEEGDDNG
mmetsp:Transcript_48558/g.103327  ORF Transcript_48558/g.103327 Transcript_48558/m.103327 type:complete len:94 (-) Transcript_48558:695-976(-)